MNFRVLHQLGMYSTAAHEYRKCIEAVPSVPHGEDSKVFSLRPEAAFNLSLIYRQSGNEELARQIISKYCRI